MKHGMLSLIRVEASEICIRGALLLDGRIQCVTLELPWRNNQTDISCIPQGVYRYTREPQQIRIHDVPQRTGILIHIGNSATDIEGCIAVGTRWDLARPEIRESGLALGRLLEAIPDEGTIFVRSAL